MKTHAVALLAALALASGARAQTSDDGPKVDVKAAAKAPLEDLNVVQTEIPAVLLKAQDDVYAKPQPRSCAAIRAQVAALDDALGEDFDAPPADEAEARKARRTAQANGVLRDTASSVIPFHGWVRRLSGAAQHQQAVERAVAAGRVRRGYLKGYGQSMGCSAPAAPAPPPQGQASPSR
jgi:hypothetical protein